MIVLATDFGLEGPYLGQVKAVLARAAPTVPVIDMIADLPAFDVQAAAYLLAALVPAYPRVAVFLCVVDPGVGTATRQPVIVTADGRRYVGPGNGLFAVVAARARALSAAAITWRPDHLSASFHGRDLFAPVAARLATDQAVVASPIAQKAVLQPDWPEDLDRVVYVDRYGNAMTGRRAATLDAGTDLEVAGRRLGRARTFGDVPRGEAFWYENANGLAEIAVNQGRADQVLGLAVGSPVRPVRR